MASLDDTPMQPVMEQVPSVEEKKGQPMITLVSKQHDKFNILKSNTELSSLIQTALEGEEESDDIEVPVPEVASEVLIKVIEYLNKHAGVDVKNPPMIAKPLRFTKMIDVCVGPHKEWDAAFIDAIAATGDHYKFIFDVIMAANYMDIKPLLNLGCARVATSIKPLKGSTDELTDKFYDMFLGRKATEEDKALLRKKMEEKKEKAEKKGGEKKDNHEEKDHHDEGKESPMKKQK